MFDSGVLGSARAPIAVASVGKLAVGGTGKTPVAAWIASMLRERGARPSIVMRGYGSDEPLVHARLNPGVPVFANPDRLAGVLAASAAGCDVAVLDDGFQHRRVRRDEDVVLVSADRWREPARLLPAGPWREPVASLSRASFVIVTRRAVSSGTSASLLAMLAPRSRRREGAVVLLSLGALHNVTTGEERPLSNLRNARVLAVSGIGDPRSFEAQLREAGARVAVREFPDHHVYGLSDAAALSRDAASVEYVVCTMKDAVKLAPLWPREGPSPWYVSLRCGIEVGGAELSALLERVLAARPTPKT